MSSSKLKILKLGLLILVLISLGSFIWFTDLNQIYQQLAQCAKGFVFVVILSAFGYLFGALAWKHSFIEQQNISVWKLFYIRTIGEIITMINPTNIIAGEASKIIMLEKVDRKQLVDSIVISRFAMISSQLTLSLLCLVYLSIHYNKEALFFIVLSCIVALAYLLYKVGFQVFIGKYMPERMGRLRDFLRRSIDHFKAHPVKTAKVFGYSLIHWLMGALEFMLILYLLGYDLNFFDAMSLDMGVVIIKSLGGFVPGQIGIEEMGNKLMLDIVGFAGAGIWISVSIIRRAKQLCWIAISAIFYFNHKLFGNLKFKKDEHLIYNT